MSRPRGTSKRRYSSMGIEEAMQLIGTDTLMAWHLNVVPRAPSKVLQEVLRRLDSFDLQDSESAKMLLIDALFVEVVPLYPNLKVWKEAPLNTDSTTGIADYIIAPKRAYMATPLLCVAEAKRDDFAKGRVQCLAELAACRWNNRQRGVEIDVFGIVSNGQTWQFYRLTVAGEVYQTGAYTTEYLPDLLGALDYLCGECARNIP